MHPTRIMKLATTAVIMAAATATAAPQAAWAGQRDAFLACADLYERYGFMKEYRWCLEKAQGLNSLDHPGGMTLGGPRKPYDPYEDSELRNYREPRPPRNEPGSYDADYQSRCRKGAKICKGL